MESRREKRRFEKGRESDYMSKISGNLFCREVKTEHVCLCNCPSRALIVNCLQGLHIVCACAACVFASVFSLMVGHSHRLIFLRVGSITIMTETKVHTCKTAEKTHRVHADPPPTRAHRQAGDSYINLNDAHTYCEIIHLCLKACKVRC